MVTLEQKLEAVLFFAGGPMNAAELSGILGVEEQQVSAAAVTLANNLAGRGVELLTVEGEYELVTSPEVSDVVAAMRKEEHTKELGKASAETLAVIVYRGPVSRAELEEIRGVNCAHALRELSIRGLATRKEPVRPQDPVRYVATPALLEHLGVTDVADMPGYTAVRDEIARYESGEAEQAQVSAGVPESKLHEEEETRTLAVEEALHETPSPEPADSVSDHVDDVSFVTEHAPVSEAVTETGTHDDVETANTEPPKQQEYEKQTSSAPRPRDVAQGSDTHTASPTIVEGAERAEKTGDPADMRDVVRARIQALEGTQEEMDVSAPEVASDASDKTSDDSAIETQEGEKNTKSTS
jgi:segregation and condensation protein B